MASPYTDLDRPPLVPAELAAALGRDAGAARVWREIRVVTETGSTNDDLAAAAVAGEPGGLVLVSEHQVAGRGRLQRSWRSPPRAGLTFSLLLRPPLPSAMLPLVPLLVATATAGAAVDRTDVDVRLKWPNDLVVDDRKVGGLLATVVVDAVVVGVGLNVSTRRAELPRPDASSLQLESGTPVDRQALLLAVLRSIASAYTAWVAAGGTPVGVLARYRAMSATVGRSVRVALPTGETLTGAAVDVDDGGRLVVDTADGRRVVSAADVTHLRTVG
jgi:BirA family biotin operon repressor/biotin-[acetyl-CoA-carboxylase] ligase